MTTNQTIDGVPREFVREGRYIVVKPDYEDDIRTERLRNYIEEMCFHTPDCVVVEADWPEYEPVWRMIEARVIGNPTELDTAKATISKLQGLVAELRSLLDADQRPEGCCCPPKGFSGLWAGAMCPVHFGLSAIKPAVQPQGEPVTFQARVNPWLLECFGEFIASDQQERNHRFLEEALELVQANQCTADEAHQLVDYVYGRAAGDPAQEVGGVMVTLAALCLAAGLDMHADGETELARIWTKVDQIRAKQAAKPAMSPLPGVYPEREQPAPVAVVQDFGDPYQGAREDLSIWKRRALESEAKVREQDQIIDRLGDAINAENGPTHMGEPSISQWKLPDPHGKQSNLKDTQYAMGWNAFLDEVTRLNTK